MPVKDVDVLKKILLAEEETENLPQGFEDDPMGFILKKYPGLNHVMEYMMTESFREYVDAIFVVAPKPTTFKILLHNGQFFFLQFMGKTYQATVAGKNYYLMTIGEKERCMLAIARLLRYGNPLKTKGPEGAEQGTRPEGETGGGETGGGETGGEETGGETSGETGGETGEEGGEAQSLGENKILQEILKKSLFEEESLRNKTIKAVNSIEDENDAIFKKILKTLEFGNIDVTIKSALEKDDDAKKYSQQIADVFVKIDAPISEKNDFIEKYKKDKIVDTQKMLDGNRHSFSDIVGAGFNKDLFNDLYKNLTGRGIGPGELALSVLSKKISFSGKKSEGGDLKIGDKKIEVKGKIQSGGRFVDMNKSKIDINGIEKAIKDGLEKSKEGEQEVPKIPRYLNSDTWINEIRPKINQEHLDQVAKDIADCTFPSTKDSDEVKAYKDALVSAQNKEEINSARLRASFNDYKTYSGFDGVLVMDITTESLQYFEYYDPKNEKDLNSMKSNVSVSTTYILSPASDIMPQISLKKVQKSDSEKPTTD